MAQLEAGQTEAALKTFNEATHDDPKDGEAAFFSGVALNHLGRAQEALAQLTTARQLGFNHTDLPFETGWSLLTLRRWDEAIEQLELYESKSPGRGQTSEFLGRAYLALGKYPQADAAFMQALKRDPDLLPTVSVYRALLRQRQGNESAARDEIAGLLRGAPEAPITQLVGTLLPLVGSERTLHPRWRLSLQTAIGYNTDARGFEELKPKNPESPVPRQNSSFARIGVDGAYSLLKTPGERLDIGYDLVADFYVRQETDPDLLDQTASLEYWRALGDKFSTTWRIWDNYTSVGEDDFRNEIGGQTSLAARVTKTLSVETSYRYAFDDYLFDVSKPVLNRDAQEHALTVAAELAIAQIDSKLRGGYFHTWNLARGDDFDYEGGGVFIGISSALPWKITAEAFYVHDLDRYQNLNSATSQGNGPPLFSRKDKIDSVTLRLTRPLSRRLNVYLEYNFNGDDSNIRGYDYEQHVTSGGFVWQF